MPIEISDVAVNQTVSGQPVTEGNSNGVSVNAETTETVSAGNEGNGGTNVPAVDASGGVQGTDAETPASNAQGATPVTVDISPEALRQITSLSAGNRKLKAEIEKLQADLAAKATPDDVAAKLKRLDELESILTSPRKYAKATGKTLEDIAADLLVEDKEVADPRLDGVLPVVEELKKKLADREAADADAEVKRNEAAIAAATAEANAYAESILKSQPQRWELIQNEKGIVSEAVKAAMLVVQRDYKEKRATREEATAILYDCLDSAETFALAKKLQEDKKKIADAPPSLVKRKGLEVQDAEAYIPRRGDDGAAANGARTPKVTIDGNRSAVRVSSGKRGPTDVRTARARALRIAGADIPDTE